MVGALALTACSDSSDDASGDAAPAASTTSAPASTTTAPPAEPTTTTSAADVAGDPELARQVAVQLSDLPAGWTVDADDSDPFEGCETFAELADRHDTTGRTEPSSADFASGDDSVSGGVALFADGDTAGAFFGELEAQLTCLVDALPQAMMASGEIDDVTIDAGEASTTVTGDDVLANQMQITATAQGQTFTLVAETRYVRVGRGVAGVQAISLDPTTANAMAEDLGAIVADRLEEGVAA